MRGKKDWIGHAVDKPGALKARSGKKTVPMKGKSDTRTKPARPFKGFK